MKELSFLPDSLGDTNAVGFSQDQRWLAGNWYRCVEELIAIAISTSGLTADQASAVRSLWRAFLPATASVAGALDVDLEGARLLGVLDISKPCRLHASNFPCLPVIEAQAMLAAILRFGKKHRHALAAYARDGKARLDAAAHQLLHEVHQDRAMAKRYRALSRVPVNLAVPAFAGFLITELVRGNDAWNRIREDLKRHGAPQLDCQVPERRELAIIQQWAFATAKRYSQAECCPRNQPAISRPALLSRLCNGGQQPNQSHDMLAEYLTETTRGRAQAEGKEEADYFFTSLCDWLWLSRPMLGDEANGFERSLSKAFFGTINRQFVQRVRTAFVAPVSGWAGPRDFPWLMHGIRANFEVQDGDIEHVWLTPPVLRHLLVIRDPNDRIRLAFLLKAADNHNLVSAAESKRYDQALNHFLFALKQAPFIDVKTFASVLAGIFTSGDPACAWDELEYRPSQKPLELSERQFQHLRDSELIRPALPPEGHNRASAATAASTAQHSYVTEGEIII